MASQMTIDEFARVMSTSVRNVRAYLERGLLPAPQLAGRTGYYDETHVERMAAIQRLQREGFSLAAIGSLLEAWSAGGSLDQLVGGGDLMRATATTALDVSALFPATKFRRPVARREHIRRQRCLRRLSPSGDRHVLLTAPGGSGKSTLAQQHLAVGTGPATWLSLEAADDEAGRFWSAVLIALRAVLPELGDALLTELVSGRNVDAVLDGIAEQIGALGGGVSLVIDDLHDVHSPTIQRQLGWFLDHVPAQDCRLILCSRTRPQIAIDRLVISGKLLHLHTEDLGFDPDEAAELLHGRLGVNVTGDEVREIVAATDGWPAGVYLAGLTMRGGSSAESVLATLHSPGRQLHDYFGQEVIAVLDSAHVDFLQDISILDRFNAELCDEVRARDDSGDILDQLRDNMFVIGLDGVGYWARLHQTFAAVLQARTPAADPGSAIRHRRAAAWHERHGGTGEAIHHFVEAGAFSEAARLIGDSYPKFLNVSSQGLAVDRWLRMLPDSLVAGSTTLGLASAGVAGLRGDRAEMERALLRAEALAGTDTPPTIASTVQFMRGCFHFGDVVEGLRWARSAYRTCPPDDPWFAMEGALVALLCSWVDGPTDEVLQVAQDVRARPGTSHQPIALAGVWALTGYVLAARGHPGAVAATKEAAEIRSHYGIERVPQAANTWSSTARARRLLGDVDAAAADALAGYEAVGELAQALDATGSVVPLLIELVHARRLQGRLGEARRYARDARDRLGTRDPSAGGRLPAMLADACEGL